MLKDFVFGPRVEAIQDDAFLPSADEIVDFGNYLTYHPIITFFFTNLFAKDFLVLRSDFDATFSHFAQIHTAKIGFRDAMVGEVINRDGFATASHAHNGKKFYIFIHAIIIA